MIKFENVVRKYGQGNEAVYALKGISFSIPKSCFTVILGPSGSGKSTTLNLIGGMDTSTSGAICIDNQDVTQLNDKQLTNFRRESIGFVFQFYNLIPSLTSIENVELTRSLNKSKLDAKKLLEDVGLGGRLHNFPHELSGGELQRTAIARALVKNPQILLCDEPTGALDTETGLVVLALLKKMADEEGKTVVVVTHNELVAEIADRVIYLKDGEVVNIQDNETPKTLEEVNW